MKAFLKRAASLWRSSKLFSALVMLAIVVPAVISTMAFRLLVIVLLVALMADFVVATSLSDGQRQGRPRLVWAIAGPMLMGGMIALAIIRQWHLGVLTLVLLAGGTFLNDVGAQTIGKLCARRLKAVAEKPMPHSMSNGVKQTLLVALRWCARKLSGQPFKHISPNKTWVGLIGGLVTGWAAAMGFLWWFATVWDYPLGYGITLAIITPPLAVGGDAIESAAKRALCIKDMSHILGAHGGFSDRLDAISATAIGGVILAVVFGF